MNDQDLVKRIRELIHPLSPVTLEHKTKLTTLSGIKCVAFDFYGTMFISGVGDIGVDEEDQLDGAYYFEESLKETGFLLEHDEAGSRGIDLFEETVDNLKTAAKQKGVTHPEPEIRAVWWDVLTKLLDEGLIKGELTKELATRFGIEFEFRINDVWPVPNLEALLLTLADRNMELGIISNSQFYTPLTFEASMGKSLAEFGFNPHLLIWSYQTGRKKPSPHFYEIFVESAEKEGLKPGEVLYVGNDIRKDIEPAKSLGMKTALYVGDQRSIRHEPADLEKEQYRPNLIIDDLHQIPNCLG